MLTKIRSFFKFEERGTNFRAETLGGIVTFLAMSYILVVNPIIVSDQFNPNGIPYGGVFIATAAGSFVATMLMALIANLPIALAPGMGINAFFIGTIVGIHGYTWQEALALSFIAAVIYLVITLTGIRRMLIDAIPGELKAAIGAGIGFFIAVVGLKSAGLFNIVGPDLAFALGNFSNPTVLLALFSIVVIVVIHNLKGNINRFSFIISILATTILGVVLGLLGVGNMPAIGSFDYSPLSSFTDVAFVGVFEGLSTVFTSQSFLTTLVLIYALLFVDIFDTVGTLVGVGRAAGLEDEEGNIYNIDRALLVDSLGTFVSSTLGTPEITPFVESATGVEAGAKTGFSSIVVAILFLVSIALFPIFQVFTHSSVTAGALVLVGILMTAQLKEIEWGNLSQAIPAFMTIIFMVVTGSIADGIAFGFIFYTIIKLVKGEAKEVHPIIYVSSALFIVYIGAMALI